MSAHTRHGRPAGLLLAVVLALVATLAVTSPAVAKPKKPSCGRQVINDWEDGRIDGTYPERCYREALRIVPADAREYSSFESDVLRALQAAVHGNVPPGQIGNPFGAKWARAVGYQRQVNKLSESFNHRDEVAIPISDLSPLPTGVICVLAGCGTAASGLPVPLLVLGGIAILLLAAGTTGMVLRRVHERRLPPPETP